MTGPRDIKVRGAISRASPDEPEVVLEVDEPVTLSIAVARNGTLSVEARRQATDQFSPVMRYLRTNMRPVGARLGEHYDAMLARELALELTLLKAKQQMEQVRQRLIDSGHLDVIEGLRPPTSSDIRPVSEALQQLVNTPISDAYRWRRACKAMSRAVLEARMQALDPIAYDALMRDVLAQEAKLRRDHPGDFSERDKPDEDA